MLSRAGFAGLAAKALEQLERQGDRAWSLPEGVWYGVGETPGPVAALFPGQGSQYVGMMRELSCIFPELLEAVNDAGEIAGAIYPHSAFGDEAKRAQEAALTRTDVAQPALGAVSRGALEVLRRFGPRIDLAAGHSYGELVALYAAGRIDGPTLHRLSVARGQLMAGDGGDRGTMLAVMAPLEAVEAVASELPGLVLANRNTPAQGVLSGSREAIDRAEALCRERGLRTRRLEVAAAFHSPLVADAERGLREALEQEPIRPGSIPVIADATAAPYPEAATEARDLLASQLARPVRFVEVVEQLYAAGARTFVEIGPKAALTGMVRSILGDRPFRAVAIDASSGRRGLFDLAATLGQLAAWGYEVDLAAWQRSVLPPRMTARPSRTPRMVVPISGANYRDPVKPLPRPARLPSTNPAAMAAGALPAPVAAPSPAVAPAMQAASISTAPAAATPVIQSVKPRLNGPTGLAPAAPHLLNGGGTTPRPLPHRVNGGAAPLEAPFRTSEVTPMKPESSMIRSPYPQAHPPDVEVAVARPGEHLPHGPAGSPDVGQDGEPAVRPAPGSNGAAHFLLEALRASQESLRAMQSLQERTASIHQRFLEGQDQAQRGFQQVLDGQQRLIEHAMGMASALPPRTPANAGSHAAPSFPETMASQASRSLPAAARPPAPPTTATYQPVAGSSAPAAHEAPVLPSGAAARVLMNGHVPPAAGTTAQSPAAANARRDDQARPVPLNGAAADSSAEVVPALLAVVAEATGYPIEMLGLDMHMESDLGIDSIKRVEILSMLSARVPRAPSVEPERLGSLHTLRQVAGFIQDAMGGEPAALDRDVAPPPDVAHTAAPNLAVARAADVAPPPDVAQTAVQNLAVARAADVAPLPDGAHTAAPGVADARDAVQAVAPAAASTSGATSTGTPAPADDASAILLSVVSSLTGYPLEMLGLDLHMEADLGIDSIKRVEILSMVSDRVPGARAVEPEQMSGLQTLGQVLEFIGSNQQSAPPGPPAAPATPDSLSRSRERAGVRVAVSAPSEPPATPDPLSRDVVLDRQALTLCELDPLSGEAPLPIAPGATVWITEDGSPVAPALADALTRAGYDCRVLDPADASTLPDGPVSALLLLAPRSLGGSSPWSPAAEQRLKDVFALVRTAGPRLREAAGRGGALLASITRIDGGFGLTPDGWANASPAPLQNGATPADPRQLEVMPIDPLQAGLAGLVKSAAREWSGVRCRAIDLSPAWVPRDAAVALRQELSADGPLETGLTPNGRWTPVLEARSVGPIATSLDPQDVVVVTGGARGVTAACALELAKAAPAGLLLLGRTPAPTDEPDWLTAARSEAGIKRALLDHAFRDARPTPRALGEACQQVLANREVRQTLERLAATGARVSYRAVDIRDAAALAATLEAARLELGPIRGLIHGAGVLQDRRIEDKTDAQFADVFDTKVAGLRNLLEATSGDPLRFLALFTSVSGRFGRRGQADYATANQALSAVACREAARRPACRVVAIDWGPWEGGMVTPALRREFEKEGAGLIPLEAGARHLVRELLAGPGEAVEVVVGHGLEAPAAPPLRTARAVQPIEPAQPALFAPTNGARPRRESGERQAQYRLDPAVHRYLDAHRIAGRPVLPMAIIAEWLARAARKAAPGVLVGLDDLRLQQGIALDGDPLEVEVWSGDPQARADLTRVPVELRGARGRVHARAVALIGETSPEPPAAAVDPGAPLRSYGLSLAEIYREHLFHGPLLHALEAIDVSPTGLVARLRSAPAPAVWIDGAEGAWTLDPLLIDGCFQAMILWCRAEQDAPSLPSRLGAYRQYVTQLPTGPVQLRAAVRRVQGRNVDSDLELRDDAGQLLARLEGYVCTVAPELDRRFREGRERRERPGNATAP